MKQPDDDNLQDGEHEGDEALVNVADSKEEAPTVDQHLHHLLDTVVDDEEEVVERQARVWLLQRSPIVDPELNRHENNVHDRYAVCKVRKVPMPNDNLYQLQEVALRELGVRVAPLPRHARNEVKHVAKLNPSQLLGGQHLKMVVHQGNFLPIDPHLLEKTAHELLADQLMPGSLVPVGRVGKDRERRSKCNTPSKETTLERFPEEALKLRVNDGDEKVEDEVHADKQEEGKVEHGKPVELVNRHSHVGMVGRCEQHEKTDKSVGHRVKKLFAFLAFIKLLVWAGVIGDC